MVKYIWYKNLYYGEKAARHKKLIKFNIRTGHAGLNTFVLVMPGGDSNMFDIYRTAEFKQKIYNSRTLRVVGIAKGKEEALELTTQIINDVYTKTGGFDVRKFFQFD